MRIENNLAVVGAGVNPTANQAPAGVSFADFFQRQFQETNHLQANAEHLIEQVALGQEIPMEQVALAVTKADMALRTLIQFRNKLVSAFQELRQMQI